MKSKRNGKSKAGKKRGSGSTSRKTWKSRERKIAAFFGSQRTPLSGGSSGHTRSDTLHPRVFVEAKLRKRHTAVSLWDGTAVLARKEKKIPVICLAEKGRPDFWVMVKSTDFLAVSKEVVQNETIEDLESDLL